MKTEFGRVYFIRDFHLCLPNFENFIIKYFVPLLRPKIQNMKKITQRKRKIAVLCSALVILGASCVLKNRRVRRYGVKPLLKLRKKYGQFEKLFRYIKANDEEEFFAYTRMTPKIFQFLLSMVSADLEKCPSRKNALKPELRLALTLHFLAEGLSMREIARNYFIGRSTAHYIIRETCQTIWKRLSPVFLPAPTKEHFKKISGGFFHKWNIPNCIGALDGKHCLIQAPYKTGSEYFSYKKSFSLILMATCDAFYKFSMVDIGSSGSRHDSQVFKESTFGNLFMEKRLLIPEPKVLPGTSIKLPCFLVADEAFPLHDNIMRPYPGPRLPVEMKIFNYRISRARRTMENTFGILAQRWRILRGPIIADIESAELIVQATVVLHNFMQCEEEFLPDEDKRYCSTGFVDEEGHDGAIALGRWRTGQNQLKSVGRIGTNNSARHVRANRDMLRSYFMSPNGSLPWQLDHVLRGSVPE